MKKEVMKNLSIFVIWMATIIFAACSSDENIIVEQPIVGTYTLSVKAIKGNDATRALTLSGDVLNATWTAGDVVTVYNVTKSAALSGTLIAQGNGASTTLRGTLTGNIANGDELKLKYLSPSYSSQDGTLATIATTCDYAEATVTVSSISGGSITTTSSAIFANQQAIVEFTLKDEATNDALNATKLTVTAGGTTINVTPPSATDVLYVAIPGISSQTVSLSATVGGTGYTYEKTGTTFTNSKFYGLTVSMNENPLAEYLTFEAKKTGASVTFFKGSDVPNQIEYSTDGISWTTYSSYISLNNVGDKVYFRGNNAAYGASNTSNCSRFSCDGCYIYGNIMSLIDRTEFATTTELTDDYTFAYLFGSNHFYNHPTKKLLLPATKLAASCYQQMFSGCTNLTIAPELPATTLAARCYYYMFSGCESMTTVPVLSVKTLAEYCYSGMFNGCTSLTTAPVLPATTLVTSCYDRMFLGCTNLVTAPALPATTLASNCYECMFWGCTSLITPPALPATTLASNCYECMFRDCTNMTTAPALPATTLASCCYIDMFNGCTGLSSAPELPATTLTSRCYEDMFFGCTSMSTAPDLPATTLAESCYSSMFQNCTGLSTAPTLSATTLANNCYSMMFAGCSNLTSAPDLPATTLTQGCYHGMFQNCKTLTTAPVLAASTLISSCYDHMFYGCTKLNSITCLATDYSYITGNCTYLWLDGVAASGTFTKASSKSWTTGADGIPSGWTVYNYNE